MAYLDEFFKIHGASVASVAIALLTMLTVFHILGITFAEPEDDVVDKVVTIETFDVGQNKHALEKAVKSEGAPPGRSDNPGGACARYEEKPHVLERYCNKLSDAGCRAIGCCVWLNGSRCVAGDAEGPTFHTHDGRDIDVKYYRHRGACVGECPAKID